MKKKWTMTFALLALSTALVGCGQTKTETKEIEDITSPIQDLTADDSAHTDETLDSAAAEETVSQDTETSNESNDSTVEKDASNSTKDEVGTSSNIGSAEQVETSKPETSNKPSTSAKPETSNKPVATTKPDTSNKPSTTTKPEASNKPNTTTKPEASNKPNTPPSETVKPTTPPSESPKPEQAPETPAPSLSCSSIFSKITSNMDDSKYQEVDDVLLQDFYGIDTSLLEDFCVKVPMLSFSITEVGVFKVKDMNNIDTVVSSINKRADNIGIMLYPSLEETYNSRKVVTNGQYILFVISDDVNNIVANFNALF